MIFNVRLHKQFSNIEINTTVSMNKLTKDAVTKHLLPAFLSYCLLMGLSVLLNYLFISI